MTGFSSSAASLQGITFQAPEDLDVEDPDPPVATVTITSPPLTVNEGATAGIQFELSSAATSDFTLHYEIAIDTDPNTVYATLDSDVPASGTVQVVKGDVSGTISVATTDDTEIDAGILEVFVVRLVESVDGSYSVGATGHTVSVTINDGICDRAEIVRNAITGKLTGNPTCFQVTEANLNGIAGTLDLSPPGTAVTLKTGEFRGLTGLKRLNLSGWTSPRACRWDCLKASAR